MKKAKAAKRKTLTAVSQTASAAADAHRPNSVGRSRRALTRGQWVDKPGPISFHIEPLPATFSLIGMLGFIITTVFTVSGRVPLSWGVAFDIVFALMFIASMISITPRFAGWD